MLRLRLLLLAFALACACAVPARAAKGVYVGGSTILSTAGGDLDGSRQVTNAAGDRRGSAGSLDTGIGLGIDVGWNFTNWLGIEAMTHSTSNSASHNLEGRLPYAAVTTEMVGVRLSAPLSKSFDVFARGGLAYGEITYPTYGRRGSTTAGVFTSNPGKDSFTLKGAGSTVGIGLQFLFGGHFGLALSSNGYTLALDKGAVGSEHPFTVSPSLHTTITESDLTFTWLF